MKMNYKSLATLSLGVVALALPLAASAQMIETESNNTFATGNLIPAGLFIPSGAVTVDGTRVTDDVDYFRLDLNAGDWLTVLVATKPGDPDDSLLGIFAPDGTLYDSDDDDGPGFNSAWSGIIPTTGRWGLAVSSFGDDDFNGTDGVDEFTYKMSVGLNAVPEPASLAVLGLGAVGLLRRRARKA